MLLHIPKVLDAAEVAHCRAKLEAATWVDGRSTAGYQGAAVKRNHQLAEDSPVARELGALVLGHLERHPLFISAALPARVYPPLFNRYESEEAFGLHVDNVLRLLPDSGRPLRTDISATLFLAEPADYDGGELQIEDTYGRHGVKLAAGDLVLYPASSLHRVTPVTRGTRLAAFFWVQSMVRDPAQRALLFELDTAIQRLRQAEAEAQALLHLTGSYHNLLRMWSDV